MNKNKEIKSLVLEDLLLAFRRKIMEMMKNDTLHKEMTMSQFEVLRMIGTKDSQTMKDIALGLNITPPSATALIEDMEKKGLVIREKDVSDRRVVSIRLTKKSRSLFSRVSKNKKMVMDKMLSKLSPEDKKCLERIIRIIISK